MFFVLCCDVWLLDNQLLKSHCIMNSTQWDIHTAVPQLPLLVLPASWTNWHCTEDNINFSEVFYNCVAKLLWQNIVWEQFIIPTHFLMKALLIISHNVFFFIHITLYHHSFLYPSDYSRSKQQLNSGLNFYLHTQRRSCLFSMRLILKRTSWIQVKWNLKLWNICEQNYLSPCCDTEQRLYAEACVWLCVCRDVYILSSLCAKHLWINSHVTHHRRGEESVHA